MTRLARIAKWRPSLMSPGWKENQERIWIRILEFINADLGRPSGAHPERQMLADGARWLVLAEVFECNRRYWRRLAASIGLVTRQPATCPEADVQTGQAEREEGPGADFLTHNETGSTCCLSAQTR
ncbi:hypothetical protein MHYP_G00239530 [Metynnis hypsauchen]